MMHTRRLVSVLGLVSGSLLLVAAPPKPAPARGSARPSASSAADTAALAKPSPSAPLSATEARRAQPVVKPHAAPARPAAKAAPVETPKRAASAAASPAPAAAPAKPAAAAAAAAAAVAEPGAELLHKVLSQPMYRRFVHPGAKVIAGIDLARIQDSPVGKLAMSQAESTGWKKKAAEAGMDFASDVERLMLSSPGDGEKGALTEEAPFVVAVQGKFKVEKLRKTLTARKAHRFVHQGAEVWMPPKSDTGLAIVNAQVMLVGDKKSLRAVLDAQDGQSEEDERGPVRRRADELAGLYDIWLVSEASMESMGASAASAGPMLPFSADVFNSVDRFELGLSFRQGLNADISFHGRTPEDTAKLASVLTGVKAMLAMAAEGRQKEKPELAAMLEKLKIGTDGDRAVLSVAIAREDIERAMKPKPAAAVMAKSSKPKTGVPTVIESAAAAAVPAPPPPAPAPLVVRIYNAEGGTREVTLRKP